MRAFLFGHLSPVSSKAGHNRFCRSAPLTPYHAIAFSSETNTIHCFRSASTAAASSGRASAVLYLADPQHRLHLLMELPALLARARCGQNLHQILDAWFAKHCDTAIARVPIISTRDMKRIITPPIAVVGTPVLNNSSSASCVEGSRIASEQHAQSIA